MPWWDVIGWTGSVLVVVSLMVASVRRFRILNLVGSLIAALYNLVFGIWPYAAMNAVIALIDAYWLARMSRQGERSYAVCPAEAGSPLVARFAERHGLDMRRAFPGFEAGRLEGARVLLTLCEDEVVGLFAYAREGEEGEAGRILVDYVTPRYRDLKPGRTLYADPALGADGLRRLVVRPEEVTDRVYFQRQGFTADGDGLLSRPLARA